MNTNAAIFSRLTARILEKNEGHRNMSDPKSQRPIYPDFAGKVALVTGSSRGIGAETACFLAANEVKVAVNGRHAEAV